MSYCLLPHGLQHDRLPCPSLSSEVCSNSCPLSQWCHQTISSSITHFSSCPQSFPKSGSFPMSWLFASCGQGIWSFSFSISPSNEYSGLISFRIDWCDLLAVRRDSQESSPALQFESINSLALSLIYYPILTSIHDHWKNHSFDLWTFVGKIMSLFFYMLSNCLSFASKEQASSNFMAAVTICSDFEARENEICHRFHCFPIYLPWSDRTGCHDLSFMNVGF